MLKRIYILLFFIFLFGFILRVMYLPQNILTFGYDQARDAVNALEIAHGHLKIFGPPASQSGLFHGVFYYYVLAPFYLIGKGNPVVAGYGIALINTLGVFLVYTLGYFLTKKKTAGLIAAFLFAISFEATQYATWMSNPTLGIITVPLIYLGLWGWLMRKEKYWSYLTALGLGLSIQSEIFLAYHLVPIVIWLVVMRKNINRRQIIVFIGTLLVVLSTMIMAQLKFGIIPTLAGIRDLAGGNGGNLAYEKSLGDYLILYLNQIGRIFSFNSYPGNVGWGGGFVIGLIIYSLTKLKDMKGKIDPKIFLSTWLLSHLSVVTVGGTSTPFLMVGIGPAVSILIAYFIGMWAEKKYYLLAGGIMAVLIFGNIWAIVSQNKSASTLFSIQKDMVLTKELSAIDYTYHEASGKSFNINSLTSPLWVNIVWSYLYKWYGQEHYGYVPTWRGRGQEGQVISLMSDDVNWEKGFLIIEPQDGIPPQYLPALISQEDSYSNLVKEQDFGAIRVQERLKKLNR